MKKRRWKMDVEKLKIFIINVFSGILATVSWLKIIKSFFDFLIAHSQQEFFLSDHTENILQLYP